MVACWSGSFVDATACTGFTNDNARQGWKSGLQSIPYPAGNVLAGRVFQAWNVVQIVVIQLFPQGKEGGFDVGEVHYPAGLCSYRAADMQGYLKGVAMKSAALVVGGDIRQPVGCFDRKFLEDIHGKWGLMGSGSVILCQTCRKWAEWLVISL
jgi:hypothetical protein